MAIERYVRRRWPEILVAWPRLLSGEFRDPLVARDIGCDCSLFFPHLSRRLPADRLTSTGRLILRSWQTNVIVYIFKADKMEPIMGQVIIYPGEDEFFIAECPSLPGCISQGKTREEAISNIREAIEGYIASRSATPTSSSSALS